MFDTIKSELTVALNQYQKLYALIENDTYRLNLINGTLMQLITKSPMYAKYPESIDELSKVLVADITEMKNKN